jgi:rare lipoprotein A
LLETPLMTARAFAAVGVFCCYLITSAHAESGMASVYSYESGPTASGERVNPRRMTAAHRTLPFGTWVKVTNKKNGRSVRVRINDRGPFKRGRVIDVTPAAAKELGFNGLAVVSLERM